MNYIKTKKCCNNVSISFKLCAPDIHVQNGEAERFRWLIMEKACIIRLSANLPHKFSREIVAIITYLYNCMPQVSNN